jgi:hypothetical protein
MQVIKTRVDIPDSRHLSLQCHVPETIPTGMANVMIIFETAPEPNEQPRKLGQFKGQIKIADDFDVPLGDRLPKRNMKTCR